ncbi:MAG: ATP-binding protein [Gammaproteobacteria bacterium]|nr:ATP-binding protein [Gammaproteobacteria bacterium]
MPPLTPTGSSDVPAVRNNLPACRLAFQTPVVGVLLGFSAVIALMIAIVVVCFGKMEAMRDASNILISDYDKKASLISAIRWNVQQRILLLRDTFLITDPFEIEERHTGLQSAAASRSLAAVDTLNAMQMTSRQRQLMDAFIQSASNALPAYNTIMQLHREGHAIDELQPLFIQVFAAQQQAIAALDEFDTTLAQMRAETIAAADTSFGRARSTLIWLGTTGTLLAIAIMMYITRWNQRSIAALHNEREKLKQAEADVRRLNATLERRVVERTASLEAANRELEAFSYSVSHDLKGPLRAINGFCHILEEDCAPSLNSHAMRHLARIRTASVRMGELLDGLLMLSHVFRSELAHEPLDIGGMAAEIVQRLRDEAPEREVEVHIHANLTATGDPSLVRLMLENLLENAWKFTAAQRLTRLEVGRSSQAGQDIFYVKDNGSGFDMEYATKLFQPFVRLHSDEEFEGTGIGLATVRRIVQRHGGNVWAEGVPYAGASIYFTFGNAVADVLAVASA